MSKVGCLPVMAFIAVCNVFFTPLGGGTLPRGPTWLAYATRSCAMFCSLPLDVVRNSSMPFSISWIRSGAMAIPVRLVPKPECKRLVHFVSAVLSEHPPKDRTQQGEDCLC